MIYFFAGIVAILTSLLICCLYYKSTDNYVINQVKKYLKKNYNINPELKLVEKEVQSGCEADIEVSCLIKDGTKSYTYRFTANIDGNSFIIVYTKYKGFSLKNNFKDLDWYYVYKK